jgi:purine-binding chemotaxis protein CheW
MKMNVNHEADRKSTRQFVTFKVRSEEYGVDIMAVSEIRGWSNTTPLPNQPGFVLGIISIRGSVIPIVDLRAKFGFGATSVTPTHVIVIVQKNGRTTGILADAISDIVSATDDDIQPLPSVGDQNESLLDGLIVLEDRLISLASIENLTFKQELIESAI